MSSNLTSVSINKNKSRFAPKVKSRPNSAKRAQANDAPTSSTSSSTSTDTTDRTSIEATPAQGTTDSSTQLNKSKETIPQQSSSIIPSVTSTSDVTSTSSSTAETSGEITSATTKKSVSKKSRPLRTPMVIAAPSSSTSTSSTTTSTVKKSTTISEPVNANKRSATRIDTPNTPSTPIPNTSTSSSSSSTSKNDEQITSTGDKAPTVNLTKKQKQMKNIKDAMKKSDKTPSPISTPKPTSGHSFAAPSNVRASSTTTRERPSSESAIAKRYTATITSRKRRVQMVRRGRSDDEYEGSDDGDNVSTVSTTNEDDELNDNDSDNEYTEIMLNAASRRKRRRTATAAAAAAKAKKKKEVLLAKDMKTLDDLTTDPLVPEDLDRDIKYFIKDLPRGVVTKQFRDEQIEREQEQLKREEEAATLKNDQEALDRLAEQRLALEQQKEKEEAELARKVKEEEEEVLAEEQRKKQQQSGGLAESNHALQVRIVNGKIVLDTDSMMIDRNKDREEISHENMEVVEENAQSRKVNFKTYGKNTGNKRWTDEETDLFYDLLSQFGSDFEMIAQMIPNRSRTQVRLKYNKEQKMHPEKVTEYMVRKKKPLDLETFKKVTGLEFEKVPDHFHTLQIV